MDIDATRAAVRSALENRDPRTLLELMADDKWATTLASAEVSKLPDELQMWWRQPEHWHVEHQ